MVKPVKFISGLCVLSNTDSLCRYLQGRTVEVISTRRNADMTIETLRQCPSEESFNRVGHIVSVRVLKIKRRLTSSQFELREVRALRQTPSRSLEDLESDHAQRQTQLTPESHHDMSNYYTSITKVLPELEPRFSRNNLCFGKHLSQ